MINYYGNVIHDSTKFIKQNFGHTSLQNIHNSNVSELQTTQSHKSATLQQAIHLDNNETMEDTQSQDKQEISSEDAPASPLTTCARHARKKSEKQIL